MLYKEYVKSKTKMFADNLFQYPVLINSTYFVYLHDNTSLREPKNLKTLKCLFHVSSIVSMSSW